jgi:hypothetical protein
MMILGLVHEYIPSHQDVVASRCNIAQCASRSYDLKGMRVGTVAAGVVSAWRYRDVSNPLTSSRITPPVIAPYRPG